MDAMVLATQKWLNAEYGDEKDWVILAEDGVTGWGTIGGLTRALQCELGIVALSSNFGETTTREYVNQIGLIGSTTNVSQNVLKILSGSLWCKGYYGTLFDGPISFDDMRESLSDIYSDLGIAETGVDVKLMKSLLSMDAYVIPVGSRGNEAVREFQQWLNGTYVHRRNFSLIPCDGIPQRNMLTGLLYAIQFEIGMDDDTANGYFGPGTKEGLRTQATVLKGSRDGSKRFVHLCQGSLRFNGFSSPFDGYFGSDTDASVRAFQAYMELDPDGICGYGTWASLLVSCGDESRATQGFDTSTQLTFTDYQGARSIGYTHVGRYTVGASKFITSEELADMKRAGMLLFPIHQRFNNSVSEMTYTKGAEQGVEAVERARVLGLPNGSTLFFCVDFDPTENEVSGSVSNFFRAVHETVSGIPNWSFEIGVYGTRNVCQTVIDKGYASTAFVAGMSWGWSGNMGFPMPKSWSYNQIVGSVLDVGNRVIEIDKVVVSRSAKSVSLVDVNVPPITQAGENPTATGFDMLFEWVVKAELASERAGIAPTELAEVVLGYLRKPMYWSEGELGPLWQLYTPESPILLRKNAEYHMGEVDLTPSVFSQPDIGLPSYHDYPHLAASSLGYLCHPEGDRVPIGPVFSLGDFGAWELDLVTLWRAYLEEGEGDLRSFMVEKFAAPLVGSSPMSLADVISDADAYLIADEILGSSSMRLSTVLRSLYKQNANERFRSFYRKRFQGSKEVFQTVFGYYTGPEYYDWLHALFGAVVDLAFRISRRPSDQEVAVIAEVVDEFAHDGILR